MNIIELIPEGKANAINRAQLLSKCQMYGLATNDRQMRRLIEEARRKFCILNLSDGKGYFMPTKDDLPELVNYIAQEHDRSMSILCNLKVARNLLEDMECDRL